MPKSDYNHFKNMPINDLAREAAGIGATGSRIEMARLVYNQRMIELQHEHAKEQIEIQHQKNMELTKKQLRWVKFSAFLTAAATLAAVLLGS